MNEEQTTDYEVADPQTLDGNAAAGMLFDIFGAEMTLSSARCAHCGNRAPMGTLRVYCVGGPGMVMRCSVCAEMVMRVMRRPDGSFLVDTRGAAYVRF